MVFKSGECLIHWHFNTICINAFTYLQLVIELLKFKLGFCVNQLLYRRYFGPFSVKSQLDQYWYHQNELRRSTLDGIAHTSSYISPCGLDAWWIDLLATPIKHMNVCPEITPILPTHGVISVSTCSSTVIMYSV